MAMVSLKQLVARDPGWLVMASQGPAAIPQSLAGIAFGSRVYGVTRDDSDYDVGVVVPAIPASVETAQLEERLRGATGLPVRLFWATPQGLVWKQSLDPIVFDVVHRSGLLWGSVEPWWREEAMSREGVLDVLATVDAMTDVGDWSDVPTGVLRHAVRLLLGAAEALGLVCESLPTTSDQEAWLAVLRKLHERLDEAASVRNP